MKKISAFIKSNLFFIITLAIAVVLLVLNAFPTVANKLSFLNEWFCLIVGAINSVIPFSLFCTVIMLALPILGVLIFFFIKSKHKLRYFTSVLGAVLIVVSCFVLSIGFGYSKTSVYTTMNIETQEGNPELLKQALDYYINVSNEHAALMEVDDEGLPTPNMSFSEIVKEVRAAYAKAQDELPFLYRYTPRVKAFYLPQLLNYGGITGIFVGPIGEGNVAPNLPARSLAFTIAHETAHGKGVMDEGEANFIAFMVCSQSNNAYLRYTAYVYAMNQLRYEYLKTATDEEYEETVAEIDNTIVQDNQSASEFAQEYESPVQDIVSDINDQYLQNNGVEEGVTSYSLVIKGILGYYAKQNG